MTWLVLLIPFFSAFAYRGRGGGFFRMPRPLWQLAYALPFGLLAFNLFGWIDALAVWALTTAANLTGHASHQDAGRLEDGQPADGDTAEWYSDWLPLSWDAQLRDIIGLSISGMLIFAPLALSGGVWGSMWWGLLIFGGFTKPLAYEAAWTLYSKRVIPEPILWAELGFGFLSGCVIAGAFLI